MQPARDAHSAMRLAIAFATVLLILGGTPVFGDSAIPETAEVTVPNPVQALPSAPAPADCEPEFQIESLFSTGGASEEQPGNSPVALSGLLGPPEEGSCRCSCGFPCKTDADCGGNRCDPFVTCC